MIGGLLLGFIWQFIFVRGFSAVGEATGLSFFKLPWLGDGPTAFGGLSLCLYGNMQVISWLFTYPR